jgi:hypothetical protein
MKRFSIDWRRREPAWGGLYDKVWNGSGRSHGIDCMLREEHQQRSGTAE